MPGVTLEAELNFDRGGWVPSWRRWHPGQAFHSFKKHLMRASSVPGTVLDAGERNVFPRVAHILAGG